MQQDVLVHEETQEILPQVGTVQNVGDAYAKIDPAYLNHAERNRAPLD